MSQKDLKDIKTEVTKECWKKLKILSIQKDVALPILVKDILERFVITKRIESTVAETE